MKALGLSESTADAVIKISTGTKTEQLVILESLKEMALQARPGEQGVLIAVLLGTLRTSDDVILLKRILDALLVLTSILHVHEEPVKQLDQQLSSILISNYKELSIEIYRIYRQMAEHKVPNLKEILNTRHQSLPMKSASRSFYLSLKAEFFKDEDVFEENIGEMVEIASTGDELDATTGRIATALKVFGEKAIPFILTKLEEADEDSKIANLVTLNRFFFGVEISVEIVNKIVSSFIEIYSVSRPPVRLSILESPFSVHKDLSEETANRFAKAIIDDIHEHKLDRNQETLLVVLRKLGSHIIGTLCAAVEQAKYVITRLKTAEVLGRIGLFYSDKTKKILLENAEQSRKDIIEKLENILEPELKRNLIFAVNKVRENLDDDDFPDKEPLYIALGKLVSSCAIDRERTAEIAEFMIDNLRTSYAYSVIEGLGHVAGAPQIPVTSISKILMLFMSLLDQKYPEELSKVRMTPDGPVFELSYETTAYTDLIPQVMKGLCRIAVAPGVEPGISLQILKRFLKLWEDLSEYRIIWGSQNVIDLSRHLAVIGLDKRTPLHQKNDIIDALMKRVTVLSVMELLGNLIEVVEETDRIAKLVGEMFKNLEELLLHDEFIESEERRTILRTMLKLAKRKRIGETAKEANRVRDMIVTYAFEGVREGFFDLAPGLHKLLELEFVTAELKEEIVKKLKRFHFYKEPK